MRTVVFCFPFPALVAEMCLAFPETALSFFVLTTNEWSRGGRASQEGCRVAHVGSRPP